MKVLLLSTMDNPLLPLFYKKLSTLDFIELFLSCDEKKWSIKDHKIWQERTKSSRFYQDLSKLSFNETYSDRVFSHTSHTGGCFKQFLERYDFDLILNAGTPRKISANIIGDGANAIVNIHPGRLPAFRGCSAVEWAIFHDQQICNTAHIMTEEYDLGPILLFEKYVFPLYFDYSDIRTFVLMRAPSIALEIVKKFRDTNVVVSQENNFINEKGQYWKPIADNMLSLVIEKVENSNYRYQKNIHEVQILTELSKRSI
jgi:methionyl-tRNA formyltransferase